MESRGPGLIGLRWREVDNDESSFKSVTNHELTIVGQTTAFVKLDVIKHPVKLDFLVCTDDGDEGLSIIPKDFPLPMDRGMRESRLNRVKEREKEESESEDIERQKLVEIKER